MQKKSISYLFDLPEKTAPVTGRTLGIGHAGALRLLEARKIPGKHTPHLQPDTTGTREKPQKALIW